MRISGFRVSHYFITAIIIVLPLRAICGITKYFNPF